LGDCQHSGEQSVQGCCGDGLGIEVACPQDQILGTTCLRDLLD
jgi:hypothetical protein